MFGLFKKAEPEKTEQTYLIGVPDLKQYVVEAYEKEKTQTATIEQLEAQLNELKEKLKAAEIEKVVLDQKNSKINDLESLLASKERRIATLDESVGTIKEDLNTYKIKYRDTEKTIEEMAVKNKKEVTTAIMINNDKLKSRLIQQVESHKGNLSKKIVADLISNG